MGKVSRAFIIANEKKPVARQIKKEVRRFLLSNGIRISSSSPQLIITVGGDGTVLFSKKYYGTPFFAIGSATSFICQAKFSDYKGKLGCVLQNLRLEKRLLLDSEINGEKLPPALNEIGIRNPEPRILSIHFSAGKNEAAFRADGIFLSTPTGSPAYCYSCGGKEMKKSGWKIQAVAISPFRRLFPPLTLSAATACTIRISGHEKPDVFLDGQVVGKLTEKDTLRIKASKKNFYFAKV
jgi:NAD+ kinase